MTTPSSSAGDALAARVDMWLRGGPEARALRDDPHDMFDELRATDPVHKSISGAWILTRYDDVKRFLRSTATLQAPVDSLRDGMQLDASDRGPFLKLMSNFLIHMDPPEHTRLRRKVQKEFTNVNVDRWSQPVADIVSELYRGIEPAGHMELLHDFAQQIPLRTINTLLGLPAEVDSERIGAIGEATKMNNYPGDRAADFYDDADRATAEYSAWLTEIIGKRRASPGDDLLSALIADSGDDALTDDEVIALVAILHLAGYATTFSLIGIATVLLLRHPTDLQAVRRDAALLPSAIEEVLRYQPSGTTRRPRICLEDMEFSGVKIPAGARVHALSQVANRDPEVFPDPHRFDIRREPNNHLTFGFGMHYCVGNFLARLETRAAVGALIRLPGLRLDVEPVWGDSVIARSYERIPVSWIPSVNTP